jgi:hypothetical protein
VTKKGFCSSTAWTAAATSEASSAARAVTAASARAVEEGEGKRAIAIEHHEELYIRGRERERGEGQRRDVSGHDTTTPNEKVLSTQKWYCARTTPILECHSHIITDIQ